MRRPVALHVLTRLIRGGPTRPVLATLQRLSRQGYRPVLITGVAEDHEDEALDALNACPDLPVLRLRSLQRSPRPLADLRALGALLRATSRLRPTVVHTHTAKAGALGRFASRLANRSHCRRVHTFHGHSLSRETTGRMSFVWRGLERALLHGATDLVITLSPQQRSEIIARLGPAASERTAVVPLAYDPSVYRGSGESRVPILESRRPGERVLAFIGRGVRVKALDQLALAHARLVARSSELGDRLRVFVIGPMEPRVRDTALSILAQAGVAQQWNFTGVVPNPLPQRQDIDGVVLPSLSEGTPMSIVEALDAGLPVIASSVGGIPEMLACHWERTGPGEWSTTSCAPRGLLLPPADPEAWAGALARWIDQPSVVPGDPDERRSFVRRVFDPDQRTADLMALYRVIGSRPAERSARSEPSPLRAERDERPQTRLEL